jgi:hypothetical protein
MARWKKKKSSFDLAGHIFLPSTSLAIKAFCYNGAVPSKSWSN